MHEELELEEVLAGLTHGLLHGVLGGNHLKRHIQSLSLSLLNLIYIQI